MPRFRIQYTSDFHLELYKTQPPLHTLLKPCAPYLALAGDIGHPPHIQAILAWAAPQWKRIFYVAGNHEYYGASSYEERHQELLEVTKRHDNVHFLHATNPSFYCEEENVAVVGLTLWSRVSAHTDWSTVNDYRQIRFANVAKTPTQTFKELNKRHATEKAVLEAEIHRWTNQGAQICVITHHMPSFRLIHPKYAMSTINECFASHSDELMLPSVRLWIYGHTHACSNISVKTTLCLCNAKGYLGEHVPGWRPDVWMAIATMDGQEAEQVAKKHQTLLKMEEEDVEFV